MAGKKAHRELERGPMESRYVEMMNRATDLRRRSRAARAEGDEAEARRLRERADRLEDEVAEMTTKERRALALSLALDAEREARAAYEAAKYGRAPMAERSALRRKLERAERNRREVEKAACR